MMFPFRQAAIFAALGDREISAPQLAKESGLCPDTIRRPMRELERLGVVERLTGGRPMKWRRKPIESTAAEVENG